MTLILKDVGANGDIIVLCIGFDIITHHEHYSGLVSDQYNCLHERWTGMKLDRSSSVPGLIIGLTCLRIGPRSCRSTLNPCESLVHICMDLHWKRSLISDVERRSVSLPFGPHLALNGLFWARK